MSNYDEWFEYANSKVEELAPCGCCHLHAGSLRAVLADAWDHGARAALAVVGPPITLADRIASPTLPAEVEKARALLDAKDAGWNEGVEACRKMLVSNGQPGLSSECLNLLIPTVPPTKEGT